jgi:hypothetical protein
MAICHLIGFDVLLDIKFATYSVFVIYNIYNNYIINNKSDEIENLKIRMAARHWQWRLIITLQLQQTRHSNFKKKKNWFAQTRHGALSFVFLKFRFHHS